MHFDLAQIIQTVGYLGVFGIIFAESGFLIGFFLPGDSLLFTAGFLASQGFFNINMLVAGCFIAAVAGDSVGYFIGHKWGRRLFHRKDSFLFHKDHLMRAENFYEKYGGKTIILARFVPVVRTFAPVVAGIGKMKYTTFLAYNLIGGFLWAACIPYAGYFLGRSIPDIDKVLLPVIGLIILISVAPTLVEIFKHEDNRKKVHTYVKRRLKREKN